MTNKEPNVSTVVGVTEFAVPDLTSVVSRRKNLANAIGKLIKEGNMANEVAYCPDCHVEVETEVPDIVSLISDVDYYQDALDEVDTLLDIIEELERERDEWKSECDDRLRIEEVNELNELQIMHRLKHDNK